ncbi:MAG: Crp/Fnr family transcriptional regulator [Burkholderiaceae bacterium]
MTPESALLRHLTATLGPLPPAAADLCRQAHCSDLARGEALLREGTRWQHLWWLEAGALRLYYLDRQGQASNKNFYLDGSMVWPITPALRDQAVHFWVEAIEPSRIWATPWKHWAAAAMDIPSWRSLEHRSLATLLQDKMSREHSFLQMTATERYLAMQTEHPDWLARIPLRHLASWLGITDVALSRIRRRLNPG